MAREGYGPGRVTGPRNRRETAWTTKSAKGLGPRKARNGTKDAKGDGAWLQPGGRRDRITDRMNGTEGTDGLVSKDAWLRRSSRTCSCGRPGRGCAADALAWAAPEVGGMQPEGSSVGLPGFYRKGQVGGSLGHGRRERTCGVDLLFRAWYDSFVSLVVERPQSRAPTADL
jgi:hypothetical protein